jgi:N-acetylmuramoyl-L-alanine amidase
MILALAATLLVAGPLRVFIDAGHGTDSNRGTHLQSGEWEDEATLRIGRVLAEELGRQRGFSPRLSRTTTPGPSYEARKTAATAWAADALISLHVDARVFAPDDGRVCPSGEKTKGFLVIYSDWGDAALVRGRRRLARLVARSLQAAGFPAYDGRPCLRGYVPDGRPGVLIERRVLFILRRPAMPSIIVETHDGEDAAEVEAWRLPDTVNTFAKAMRAALVAYAAGKGVSHGP